MAVRITEVHSHLRRKPFQPFRLCLSDGSEHLVSNPDWVFLTRDSVMIGVGLPDEVLPERVVYCDPRHISRIEPTSAPSSS